MDFISILSIFVLACFVGYYVVWSVTPALHTPLMSVTNAISSVIVVGALIAAAAAGSPASKWLGLVAVALASVNIFGGFAVTRGCSRCTRRGSARMHEAAATPAWVLLAYLVSGVCFILALRGLSSPESSRRGNYIGMVGMAIAVVTTLIAHLPRDPITRVSAKVRSSAHFL